MRKRVITVPKNKAAERALDYDEATANQLIVIELSEEEFDALWQAGVFHMLNEVAHVIIDDYESEEITEKEQLEKSIQYLTEKQRTAPASIVYALQELRSLFEEALTRGTGVFFLF